MFTTTYKLSSYGFMNSERMTVETKKQEEILFLKYKLLNFAAGIFFLSK